MNLSSDWIKHNLTSHERRCSFIYLGCVYPRCKWAWVYILQVLLCYLCAIVQLESQVMKMSSHCIIILSFIIWIIIIIIIIVFNRRNASVSWQQQQHRKQLRHYQIYKHRLINCKRDYIWRELSRVYLASCIISNYKWNYIFHVWFLYIAYNFLFD